MWSLLLSHTVPAGQSPLPPPPHHCNLRWHGCAMPWPPVSQQRGWHTSQLSGSFTVMGLGAISYHICMHLNVLPTFKCMHIYICIYIFYTYINTNTHTIVPCDTSVSFPKHKLYTLTMWPLWTHLNQMHVSLYSLNTFFIGPYGAW